MTLLPVLIFTTLAAVFLWSLLYKDDRLPSPLIGKTVPQFDLPPIEGREVGFSSADLQGQVSLVNVWASWCVPCRVEMPLLVALAKDGVVPIYGINFKDDAEAALSFLAELGDPYTRLGADQSGRVAALDKTGTLTKGRPELTDMSVAGGFDRDQVLALVAGVETFSEHPIADAIVEAAQRQGLELIVPSAFEAIPGFGVEARIGKHAVAIGADRLMHRLGLDVAVFSDDAARLADEGKSPLYAAVDGRLAAIIAVADPIRPTTSKAIAALHSLGLKVVMITGDNRRTAEAIARRLEIDEVIAEVLPDGKVEAIKRLRGVNRGVVFVGDGINDAPALAEANVGLAIGTGTDIAIESADVVLISGDLRGVPNAIALSKATMRNIRQNLFWAFAYNVVLIPVAAGALFPIYGVLLSPVLAAAAMALSSVFVLSNALRLRAFQAPMEAENT
ncbi:heavy metal translocating P-type ATPase [Rhizobium flavum]|uniref:Heavy metal translocating P-type ATPase n=1 Tax=Pseudorhizobium flavum TaxID=1335061 RepID=A0A7W9Z213_9HYPH|nr:heavy metal translocating P-type ATPase [Pseudorhizobium flavum]